MPNLHTIRNSFAGGELAPDKQSRVDLSLYPKAAKLLRNFYCLPGGGASNRPGTIYKATGKFDNKKIRLIPFKYSTQQNYMIEFGEYYARFFTGGAQITQNQYSADYYTKLLLHCETSSFTDETGKTVTNTLTYNAKDSRDETVDNRVGISITASGNEIQKLAYPFEAGSSYSLGKIELELRKVNSPIGNVWVELCANNGGEPGTILGTSATKAASSLSTSDTFEAFVFSTFIAISSGTTYWIVLNDDRALDDTNKVEWAGNANIEALKGNYYLSVSGWQWWNDVNFNYKVYEGSKVLLDTDVYKLGAGSGYFDAVNANLSLANHTDFNLETADFSFEAYINIEALGDMWLCGNGAATAGGWGLKYDNTAKTVAFWANGASRATVAFDPDVETWYHIAVIRSSGTIKLAIDGTFGSGSSYATSISSIYTFTVGMDSQTASDYFNGWIDEVRLLKGYAAWTTDFTPPTAGSTPYEIETPYSEDDLELINYTQSADVLYLAHPTIQPQELSRITNTNWTIEDYDFAGGPFLLPNTDDTKTVASNKTALGETDATLTASGFTFQSTHVGSLWQLEHYIEGQIATSAFASATTGSAIKCGGTWRLITHGTWTGKLQVERSDDGSTGWTVLRAFTSADDYNANTYGTEDMSNNAEPFYVRLNMATYASGTCNADLTTDAFYQKGIAQISAVAVGGATATATITRTIGSTDATIDWAEGAWSDYRGWPSVVEFSPQDRLMFANNTHKPQTHWDTKPNNYVDFSRSDPLVDSDGITGDLPSREVNGITSIIPLSTIIALTSSSEWGIVSSNGTAITPTTILHKVFGYEGSAGVRPIVIGNRAIYIQALSSIVRDLGYELYSDSFTGSDISILSNHFFTGYTITEMAYQQNPDRLVWCVRSDGKMLSLTYMREQEVLAWTSHDTNEGTDLFESAASIPNSTTNYNEVWLSVKRGTKRYIECFAQRLVSTDPADQIFMDSAITYDDTPVSNLTNLDHLNGYTVAILADGNVMEQQTVAGGTLPEDLPGEYSVIHVGIPYNADLETLNVDVNLPGETIQGRKIKISQLAIRLQNSRGGYIGPDVNTLHSISNSPMAGPTVTVYDKTGVLTLCTGEVKENLGAGYEDGGRIFFRQSDPLPVTILAILPVIQIGGVTGT